MYERFAMVRRTRGVVVVAFGYALACLALAVVAGTPGLAVALLVVGAALMIPGLALTLALFPSGRTDTLARMVMAIGAGFATIVVGGIVMDLAGFPLATPTWLLLLAVAAAAGILLAYLRDRGRSVPTVMPEVEGVAAPRLDWHLRPSQLVLLVAALLIATGSIRIAQIGVANQQESGFTQLWILPAAGSTTVQVGVTNAEGATQTYRLELTRGSLKIGSWPSVELDQGATWTVAVTIPGGGPGPVEARLYRSTDPSIVYRSVSYWLPG